MSLTPEQSQNPQPTPPSLELSQLEQFVDSRLQAANLSDLAVVFFYLRDFASDDVRRELARVFVEVLDDEKSKRFHLEGIVWKVMAKEMLDGMTILEANGHGPFLIDPLKGLFKALEDRASGGGESSGAEYMQMSRNIEVLANQVSAAAEEPVWRQFVTSDRGTSSSWIFWAAATAADLLANNQSFRDTVVDFRNAIDFFHSRNDNRDGSSQARTLHSILINPPSHTIS